MELKPYLYERISLVESELEKIMPSEDIYPSVIHKAMRYSLFAGGKRLRPILCLAAAEAVGQKYESLLPVACALEMLHTYSLIHDDLPAMDNDDYRRGKLTNHKIYGEGISVLTGDALLTYAFEILSRFSENYSDKQSALQVMSEIANSIGTMGMIGGQVVDIQSEGKNIAIDKKCLTYVHTHKTGALFRVALRAGAILSSAKTKDLENLTIYAEKFGLAFQITDDILDVIGEEDKLGKSVGSDAKNYKATYPALYGLDESKQLAQQAINEAIEALKCLSGYVLPLELMVRYLYSRES
ncbi:MAG: polyprenyl synthetase family protein [Clostridia bacterium]|nr:polyprenyl synthetase family protein [Clostridia bacterium]